MRKKLLFFVAIVAFAVAGVFASVQVNAADEASGAACCCSACACDVCFDCCDSGCADKSCCDEPMACCCD